MSTDMMSGVLTSGSLGSTLANAPAGAGKDSPEKVKDAANQFEALLIGQILKSVHEEQDGGWMGTGDDKTSESVAGLADEYFARALSSRGGLGLANMVAKGLANRAPSVDPASFQEAQALQSRDAEGTSTSP
jgi:Rod binding domain-containing protein